MYEMKSLFNLLLVCLFIPVNSASGDTPLIRTTVADSSRIVFIAQTPLSWERVVHDSLYFIRFIDSPLTDSVGYPELPMITCLIAMPDSVTPDLDFAWAGEQQYHVNPVYPVPVMYLDTAYCTAAVTDSFYQNSTAYASASFWPDEIVNIVGETRLCGQRLIQVQLFPARYRASDSTLVTVSSISASLSFDSAEAVWNNTGLGAFQNLIDDSPILGYHQVSRTFAPVPAYWSEVDPLNGPPRMPDYVIICASGLYRLFGNAIDDLAEHRRDFNNFDVALVTTGDILDDFGSLGQEVITDETIRDFTQHMWENWTQTSGKKPSYLLLIGDHEDNLYYDENWFLPTHEYPYSEDLMIGNDEWYAYFNHPESVDNALPDMCVGRLSVKNGDEYAPDTLSTLIYNLIDLEDPITGNSTPDYRRRIVRLSGTGEKIPGDDPPIFHQNPGNDNTPLSPWSSDLASWLEYDFACHYCGDGRWQTNFESDSSAMKSSEWVENCLTEFRRGAGVAFYTNHGELHMFSAGLEWCPWLYEFGDTGDETKGCRDSTFNNYQIEQNLTSTVQGYSAPFLLMLCCSAGTFNHTLSEHDNRESHTYFCFDDESETMPYNFSSDCLAERVLKNTDVPVAGVFCGSQPSWMPCYDWYGKGILEAIYARGHGRLGDAIASGRLQFDGYLINGDGTGSSALGQFNLLGDPALDISDRVRYPDHCDLSVYPGEFNISLYPVETSTGVELPISFKVRNNGAQDSDECDIRLILRNGTNSSTVYLDCDPIDSGDSLVVQYTWDCAAWFQPPMDLTISVEVDYTEECDDCWWGNNSGSATIIYNDTYPVLDGWIIPMDEVINTTPVLANIDNDLYLEIIVLTGNTLSAFEDDGSAVWTLTGEGFACASQVLATDLTGDGKSEFILASDEGIKVVDPDGDVLQTIQLESECFCVGEMESTQGLELCTAVGNTLYLYTWNSSQGRFVSNDSKQLSFSPTPSSYALASNDLNGNSYEDIVYCCGYASSSTPPTGYNSLVVYDWATGGTPYTKTRNVIGLEVYPAVGEIASDDMVGWPCGSYDPRFDPPAIIIEPGVVEDNCASGDCAAEKLRYAVFADWSSIITGVDTFILPSEMQALAWESDGSEFGDWPPEEFSGGTLGSTISPTALGNLNNSGNADVLFSVSLDAICTLLAFDSDADYPDGSDFPISLPGNVTSYGGFSIADIDRDGTVELVFGTSDGCLHCWELGSCSTGYAPWCQFQHDEGRTGVLE